MSHILQAYLDTICVIILAFILYRMNKSVYLNAVDRSFSHVVANVLIIVSLDAVAILASGTSYPVSIVANSTFLAWMGIVGYSWLGYTETILSRKEPSRLVRLVWAIPVIVLIFISYASIWTGWVFSIDGNILYHRGPYHFVQVSLAAFYLVVSAVLTLKEFTTATSMQRRRELMTLLAVFILPVIGSILGVLFYGIPFTWTLCTVAVLIVFVNFQEYSISTDGLTGLSNRRQFDAHAEALIHMCDAEHPVFLLFMDVDRFKSINDTYGHRVGDAALVEVASLLKLVASSRHLMIARYGGDEFAVIGEFESEADAESMKKEIEVAFADRNRTTSAPYTLNLSIGLSRAGGGYAHTVDALVAEADRKLYLEKTAHRSGDRR